MKKPVQLLLCLCVFCAFAFAAGCAHEISEVGSWKLELFTAEGKTYGPGSEYNGGRVTDETFSCSFDGSSYKICADGAVVRQGSYAAERAGRDSVLLALQGDETLFWNCGRAEDADGNGTLRIVGSFDGLVVSFIPA